MTGCLAHACGACGALLMRWPLALTATLAPVGHFTANMPSETGFSVSVNIVSILLPHVSSLMSFL